MVIRLDLFRANGSPRCHRQRGVSSLRAEPVPVTADDRPLPGGKVDFGHKTDRAGSTSHEAGTVVAIENEILVTTLGSGRQRVEPDWRIRPPSSPARSRVPRCRGVDAPLNAPTFPCDQVVRPRTRCRQTCAHHCLPISKVEDEPGIHVEDEYRRVVHQRESSSLCGQGVRPCHRAPLLSFRWSRPLPR